MNALRLSKNNLEELISLKRFVITGVLETGEITLAIVSPAESEIIDKLLPSDLESTVLSECENKAIGTLYKLSELHGNNSRELIKAWEQLMIDKYGEDILETVLSWKSTEVCFKNNLQIKKFRDY